MIRITYRLIMDAPDPRQTRRILVRFSTDMEVAADLGELEKLSDSLDVAANGGYASRCVDDLIDFLKRRS
jgi:hypothetical protein